jgi:two-component system, sensor histidine kinase YesM
VHMRQYWSQLSIRTKAVVTQIIMTIVSVFACILLIVNQISAESRTDTAVASYQYCRYIVQMLDTNVRQMESMANNIVGNKYVRDYVAMEAGTQRDEMYHAKIQPLLQYAYNRYLPTHDIQIISGTTLEDVTLPQQMSFMRSASRIWAFDMDTEPLPQCHFYFQFSGNASVQAVLTFSPSASMLTDAVESIGSILKSKCAVYTTNGQLLYVPDDATEQEQADLQRLADGSHEGYTTLGNRQIGYCLRCETLPLVFVSSQQLGSVLLQWDRLLPWILICAALVLVCILLSYKMFYKGITQRVVSLAQDCESLELDKLGKDNNKLTVSVRGSDEIAKLSVSINNMLARITDLTRINEQEVLASQRAAYDMLAAQIHPHFIYNTLENLRMMAEVNGDTTVADLLYALGRMLHLSISDTSSTGDISMEMEHVRLYLQLQQMRMNGNLTYVIEPLEDSIAHISCPRFLLQPIAENAIKHGYQKRKTPAKIVVSSGEYENGVYLRVTDDGAGFSPERLNEIREALLKDQPISNTHGGIGLMNVNTRLRMFYGKDAGLTLESTAEKGTVCTLWLALNGQAPNPEATA